MSSKLESIPFNIGNAMPLSRIPDGMLVHNVELKIGKGGQLSRSAGAYARIMAKEDGNVTLRLPSGEVRMVNENCLATIGTVGNKSHENIKIGKAGRSRWLGKRPKVRGVAMNPVTIPTVEVKEEHLEEDIQSPWGTALKIKTRKKNKPSNKFIVKKEVIKN